MFSVAASEVPATATAGAKPAVSPFTQNKGQWDKQILYTSELPNGWLFLEKNGFTYNFLEAAYFAEEDHASGKAHRTMPYIGHAVKVKFLEANPAVQLEEKKETASYRNYFIGNDPAAWATHVKAYAEVLYRNLYPGTDLKVYLSGSTIKYDFILAPHAPVPAIKMNYEGAKQLQLKNGRLHILTSLNEIVEEKPYAYQDINGTRKEVTCAFTLQGNMVGFEISGSYDASKPLVIDPEIVFLSYSGSFSSLSGNTATGDLKGNTYFASRLMGPTYPVTSGAYQQTQRGTNIVISKLSDRGNTILFATYLGGGGNDEYPLAMRVNSQNELLLVGFTNSSDFPTTPQAFDRSFNGIRDYVVCRLSENGSLLLASTYVGGSGAEGGVIASIPAMLTFDKEGNVLVGACTTSDDFPVRNGFQRSKNLGQDGVIFKLNANLSELHWSTLLGGSHDDFIFDIKVGASGNVYVGGSTFSRDFPATNQALHSAPIGLRDGFVAVISADGRELRAATYLGTEASDLVKCIDLDREENVYAVGFTGGSYPITTDTYGTSNTTGGYFIHKLTQDLRTTLMSTHIGNHVGQERPPVAFSVSECNDIFIAGYALSNAPVSADALERNRRTMYLLHLANDAKELAYASFSGGIDTNPHTHLANTGFLTKTGTLYQAECTYSTTQAVTPDVYDNQFSGSPDVAVTKFQFTPKIANTIQAKAVIPPVSCAPYPVRFQNQTANAASYTWNFGDGSAESAEVHPTHTYTKPGVYRVRLIASDPNSCKLHDTTFVNLTVAAPPEPVLPTQLVYLCYQYVTLDAGNPGYNYAWSTGATSQTIDVTEPGTYTVEISLGQCSQTSTVTLLEALPPLEVPTIFTPNHDGKNDFFYLKNGGANVSLKIFNRWGKIVFKSDNYQNDWDGRGVALGAYYYMVESLENCSTQKGWFEIVH
ncbi:gliding motility-associated C-terminal domain-containing protein [Pontibacter qinzhouensis]|uniref:DUF7948 domain-containing protein n=1 Tax=Pontibacter qinzhouensis TaxID=2603253 RepID=UPI00164FB8CF|nr:gliding motility-associated C-terminal domain-containing protein [Pontibacter qinzhouensis]